MPLAHQNAVCLKDGWQEEGSASILHVLSIHSCVHKESIILSSKGCCVVFVRDYLQKGTPMTGLRIGSEVPVQAMATTHW